MTLTKEELYSLCLKADGYSNTKLELAILGGSSLGSFAPFPWEWITELFGKYYRNRYYKKICKKYLDEFSGQIYFFVKNNTESVDMVFEICQYILPTMVQQNGNLDEATVVFVITLFCRKGIMNYIKKM